MNSKTQRKRRAVVIVLSLVIVSFLSFSCKKGPTEFLYVSDIKGAEFNAMPDAGKGLAVVPCAEKLGVLSRKTEMGKSWVEVQWNDKKGWVLESSLAKEFQAEKCVSSFELKEEAMSRDEARINPAPAVVAASVEEAAKKYYGEYYANYYSEQNKAAPDTYPDDRIKTIVGAIVNYGARAKGTLGDYVVINHGAPSQEADEMAEKVDALWQKSGDGWREYLQSNNWPMSTIYLVHLNNDSYPDALYFTCLSDACTVTVYVGKDDSTMTAVQRIKIMEPADWSSDFKTGKCGETFIRVTDSTGEIHRIIFDCGLNKLVGAK